MAAGKPWSENRIIARNVLRMTLQLAVPSFLASLLVFLMNLVNYVFIAVAGSVNDLAAYGIVSTYTAMAAGFFAPLGLGASILMERAKRTNDAYKVQSTINTSLLSSVGLGILSSLFAVAVAGLYVSSIGTPAEIAGETTTFLRYFSPAFIPIVYFSVTTVLLGQFGEHSAPILAEVSAIALHIAFGYIFVVLFDYGLIGLAISAFVSQALAAIINTHLILQVRRKLFARTPVRLDFTVLKGLTKEGRNGIFTAVLGGVIAIIMQGFINQLGIKVIAAFTLFFLFQDFLFIPLRSLQQPARRLMVEYYENGGGQSLIRAVTPLILLSAGYAFLLIPVVRFAGPPLFLFFSHDPEVTVTGMRILTLVSHYFVFYALSTLISSVLDGLGKQDLTMKFNLVFNYLIRFIVLIGAVLIIRGEESIVLCYPASWAISAGALVIYYYATYPFLKQKKYSL